MKNLKVTAIQCPNCKDIIFSRTVHDCRQCSCQTCFIDGGQEYVRVGFGVKMPIKLKLELIGLSKKQLYNDWNDPLENQFGLIKTSKIVYDMLYRYTCNLKGKLYRYEKKKFTKTI